MSVPQIQHAGYSILPSRESFASFSESRGQYYLGYEEDDPGYYSIFLSFVP